MAPMQEAWAALWEALVALVREELAASSPPRASAGEGVLQPSWFSSPQATGTSSRR